jgi:hypothetical protein
MPITDDELRHMNYADRLRWAADDEGHLTKFKRLERIVRVFGYKHGWISQVYGEHWEDVWQRSVRWRKEQYDFENG